MSALSIIVFSVIYVAALVFSFIKNRLPKKFVLLGVEYGHAFKDLDKNGKITRVVIYIFTTLFSIFQVVLPPLTVFYWQWTKIPHWFIFLLVYIVTIIIWLVVICDTDAGKKRYVEQRRKILEEAPLYKRTIEKLQQDPRLKVVIPLKDGIAFYFFSLPDGDYSRDATPDELYGDYKGIVKHRAKEWEKEQEEKFSTLYNCGCNDGLLASNFGIEELTEDDRDEICLFLSKEENLGLRYETYSISCEFYIEYSVTTTKTYSDGYTSESTSDKREDATGYFRCKMATRVPKK